MSAALARGVFNDALCVVDRCGWPSYECDLLVLTRKLRVIDVEVKISRADLKADRAKSKWIEVLRWKPGLPDDVHGRRVPRVWPRNVWKHYYAIAAPIWTDGLLQHCGEASGVLLVDLAQRGATKYARGVEVIRPAKPNTKDTPCGADDAVAIARLASLRMWDAYDELEKLKREKTT